MSGFDFEGLSDKLGGATLVEDKGGEDWKFKIPKPRIGDTLTLRFLPRKIHWELIKKGESLEGSPPIVETFFFHSWRSRNDASVFRRIPCPKTKDPNAFCPICDYSARAYEAGDKDEGRTFRRLKVFIVNAAVISASVSEEDSPLENWVGRIGIFEYGQQLQEQIEKEVERFGMALYSPGKGYNFIVKVAKKKTDAGEFPSYLKSMAAKEPTFLHEDLGITEAELVELLDRNLRDPWDIYQIPSDEELKNCCLEEGIDPKIFDKGANVFVSKKSEENTGTNDGGDEETESSGSSPLDDLLKDLKGG